ncbi:MAG: hypothetical protein HOK84_03125, partial [Bacteroidetes bacterium]|nr:hypothetical protein [Bacteroidota bacterium]
MTELLREKTLAEFGRLLEIMDELRTKCPWDKEQTWEPPLGCDFAICAKCIRNQEPLPSPELEER